jgi:hypothetical protein
MAISTDFETIKALSADLITLDQIRLIHDLLDLLPQDLPSSPQKGNYPSILEPETNQATTIWMQCLNEIKSRIHSRTYDTWFAPVQGLSVEQDCFTLQVPNRFYADWLKEHHQKLITETLSTKYGTPMAVRFVVNPI